MEGKNSPKILIIGAGIAGLSAAVELIKEGFTNTTIVEAQDRIGGRIHTQKLGASHVEFGAQWLHGEDGNPLYTLADQLHVIPEGDKKYEDGTLETLFYLQNGEQIDPEIIEEVGSFFLEQGKVMERHYREGIPCSQSTVGAVFDEAFESYIERLNDMPDVEQRKRAVYDWYLRRENVDTGCDDLHETSLLSWGLFYECSGNLEVNLTEGYQPLIEHFTSQIPKDRIILNKPVQEVTWHRDQNINKSPVSLLCEGDEVFHADHVIVTSSVGFLKKHAASFFNPPFPQEKIDAIDGIGFGTVDKLFLEFEKPFWGNNNDGIHFAWLPGETLRLDSVDNIYSEEHAGKEWYRGIIGFDTVTNQPNVLIGWIAGPGAREMETCSDDLVLNIIMEMLQRFTNNPDIPQPKRFIRTMWQSNPYILGSYSFLRPSGKPTDFATLAEPMPSKMDPQVVFAGEGTSTHHHSTTHGAHTSGIQAALHIIKSYKKDHSDVITAPTPRECMRVAKRI